MADIAASAWTEDRLAKLTQLWADGLSITQIGNELGVSRNAVVGKVHRMGLPKRQSPIVRSDKPVEPKKRKVSPLAAQEWDRSKCSWPTGDPKSPDFKFCGDSISPGRPYCAKHCALAYTSMRDTKAA